MKAGDGTAGQNQAGDGTAGQVKAGMSPGQQGRRMDSGSH